jgi:5'-AMP-activated protein kinase regulatory beta subunit
MQCNAAPAKEGKVPTVFRWTHGGNQVYITGTFNNWKERIPLNRR